MKDKKIKKKKKKKKKYKKITKEDLEKRRLAKWEQEMVDTAIGQFKLATMFSASDVYEDQYPDLEPMTGEEIMETLIEAKFGNNSLNDLGTRAELLKEKKPSAYRGIGKQLEKIGFKTKFQVYLYFSNEHSHMRLERPNSYRNPYKGDPNTKYV